MKIFLFILLVSFAILSCNPNYEQDQGKIIHVTKSLENVNSLNKILKVKEIIKLETNPNCLVNQIKRVFVTTGSNFLIFDETLSSIFLFDHKGNFLHTIGSQGNGPKEYNEPIDISYDIGNELIYVLTRNKSIMSYTLDGEFKKKIGIDCQGSAIYHIGNYFWLHNSSKSISGGCEYSLLKIDEDGEIIVEYLSHLDIGESYSYLNMNNFSGYNAEIKYIRSYDYNIYSLAQPNDKAQIAYRFDFGENNLPDDYLRTISSRQQFIDFLRGVDYVGNIDILLENEKYLHVRIMLDKKTYSIYVNKDTGEIKKYLHNNINDLLLSIMPFGVSNHDFINIHYPHYKLNNDLNLDFRLKWSKAILEEKLYDQLVSLYAMEISENPVIITTEAIF